MYKIKTDAEASYYEERRAFFLHIGIRIEEVLRNSNTESNRIRWQENGWITSDEYAAFARRKVISQTIFGRILHRMDSKHFPTGSRGAVSNHIKGVKLTCHVINLYAELFGVSAGYLLLGISSPDPRYRRIDEESIRRYLTTHKEDIYTALRNERFDSPPYYSTIWRWMLPDESDTPKSVRCISIPLQTYYAIVVALIEETSDSDTWTKFFFP